MNKSAKRTLLLFGIIAPVLFIFIFLLDGATRPEYNPLHQWVSHLSLGSRGWIGTFNLIGSGALLLAFVQGASLALKKKKWPIIWLGLISLGLIFAGIFAQDPGLGYPPGAPASIGSVHDVIHKTAAFVLFIALTAFPFSVKNYFGSGWKAYANLSGIGVILSFALTNIMVSLEFAKIYPETPSGLFERIYLIIGFTFIAIFAKYLLIKQKP